MYQHSIKRSLDIIVSILCLPIVLLTFFIVAIAIKVEDKGTVLYKDTRIGINENRFIMYKFRSMKQNAPDIRNADGTTYNSENDNRVTQVGKIIRKLSIDELPQFINVIKGDMSLVGPRPSPLGDKSIYPNLFFKKFEVRPGLTGYNQAFHRNSTTMDERIIGDAFYVDNLSFSLDLKIIVATVFTVFSSKNLYRNNEDKNYEQKNQL